MKKRLAGLSTKLASRKKRQSLIKIAIASGVLTIGLALSGCEALPVKPVPLDRMIVTTSQDRSYDVGTIGFQIFVLSGKYRGIEPGIGVDLTTNKKFYFSLQEMLDKYPSLVNDRTIKAAVKQKADAQSLPTKIKHILHIG